MHHANLDEGIRKALKAQFVAAGMQPAAAEAKASAHAAAATKLFHMKLREPGGRCRSEVASATHAMAAVAAWARSGCPLAALVPAAPVAKPAAAAVVVKPAGKPAKR